MSNIFSCLISYSSLLVRPLLGVTLRFRHGQYISEPSNLSFFDPTTPPTPSLLSKNTMSQSWTTLPPVRRIVTTHDSSGKEIIRSDSSMSTQVEEIFLKIPKRLPHDAPTGCASIQRRPRENMGD